MGIVKEFRDFAMKGNVIDLAVGIIIGAAFGKIVSSLVDDVLMPPLGWIIGSVDFSKLSIALPVSKADGKAVEIMYGRFINATIQFILVAFAVFLLVKAINTARKRLEQNPPPPPPAPPAPPSKQELLLGEIRDLLKSGR